MRTIDALLEDRHNFKEISRPYVTLTYAQSLDGCITTRDGHALKISGPESMRLTHQIRSVHDAILVGIGTVLVDDPRLTTRKVPGEDPQPVILDTNLRFPLEARMLKNEKKPWLAAASGAEGGKKSSLEKVGVRVLELSRQEDRRLPLRDVLAALKREGIRHMMVEGGAQVITSFLDQRLVDMVVLTIAPMFLGGMRSVANPLAPAEGREDHLLAYPHLEDMHTTSLGDNLVVWGKCSKEQA